MQPNPNRKRPTQTTIDLQPALRDRLDFKAVQLGMTRAEAIRTAIHEWLDKNQTKEQ